MQLTPDEMKKVHALLTALLDLADRPDLIDTVLESVDEMERKLARHLTLVQ